MPSKWNLWSTDVNVENNVLTHLSDNVKIITIPYVYSSWYWALAKIHKRDRLEVYDNTKIMTDSDKYKYINGDYIIELKKKYRLREIIRLYDESKLDFNYDDRMTRELDILKKRKNYAILKLLIL